MSKESTNVVVDDHNIDNFGRSTIIDLFFLSSYVDSNAAILTFGLLRASGGTRSRFDGPWLFRRNCKCTPNLAFSHLIKPRKGGLSLKRPHCTRVIPGTTLNHSGKLHQGT